MARGSNATYHGNFLSHRLGGANCPTQHPLSGRKKGLIRRDQDNEIQILIDGQSAYKEIADAFKKAKKFIYLTISFGDLDFLLVPESEETLLTILTSRANDGVDVRMVVWQPALHTPDTIPDPGPAKFRDQ